MPRNNVHILTENELRAFKQKYIIEIEENKIVVKFYNNKRKTTHDIDKPFIINAKKFRKINFNLEAINLWKSFINKKLKCTLFDVQNAVNFLYITYQTINEKNVKKILTDNIKKINKI